MCTTRLVSVSGTRFIVLFVCLFVHGDGGGFVLFCLVLFVFSFVVVLLLLFCYCYCCCLGVPSTFLWGIYSETCIRPLQYIFSLSFMLLYIIAVLQSISTKRTRFRIVRVHTCATDRVPAAAPYCPTVCLLCWQCQTQYGARITVQEVSMVVVSSYPNSNM